MLWRAETFQITGLQNASKLVLYQVQTLTPIKYKGYRGCNLSLLPRDLHFKEDYLLKARVPWFKLLEKQER